MKCPDEYAGVRQTSKNIELVVHGCDVADAGRHNTVADTAIARRGGRARGGRYRMRNAARHRVQLCKQGDHFQATNIRASSGRLQRC